ncbi:MAG TPA: methyltransferase [Candidatus Eisenbergiella merdavium]|uniref:Methyltransferase n=1 Tax=Candidatus Eisenbergiella merdavium TaxID=2838551 RepID=A0A9D2NE71_9FIRM|nr:methyltransferase [Candidatus Eisenbergiella merdavium]
MIKTEIKNIPLCFETAPGLFSPNSVDPGTLAMLSAVEFVREDRVLDLGCGYGPVGILAARLIGEEKVIMCDISDDAIQYAKRNAVRNGVGGVEIRKSDGLTGIAERDFTKILSNPPYHTDFSVAKHFIEDGYRRLAWGGLMVMVTKRRDWYKNKLAAVFGGVKILQADGYYVFLAEKREHNPSGKKKDGKTQKGLSKKLRRKYGE